MTEDNNQTTHPLKRYIPKIIKAIIIFVGALVIGIFMFDVLFYKLFPIQLPFNEKCPSRYVDQLDHLHFLRYPTLSDYGYFWEAKRGCNHFPCEDGEWVIYAGENKCLVSYNIVVGEVFESIPMFYIDSEKYVHPVDDRANYGLPHEWIYYRRKFTCTEPKLVGVPLGIRLFGGRYGVYGPMFALPNECPPPDPDDPYGFHP